MIIYEVQASVQPELRESYEQYMIDTHIPDIMKTGCFVEASFEKFADGEYQMRYTASRGDLDTYLRDHAPRVRKDLADRFPDGLTLSRKEWSVIKHFA